MIHAIGDSHVIYNFGGDERFEIHHLGPKTIHGFSFDYSLKIEKYEQVVYCLGEIDVRCHIIKQRDLEQRKVEDICTELAENYVKYLGIVTDGTAKAVILGVIPPTNFGLEPKLPVVGTLMDRVWARKQLNKALEYKTLGTRFGFINPYEAFEDQAGALRYDMSDGQVHVGPSFKHLVSDQVAEYFK